MRRTARHAVDSPLTAGQHRARHDRVVGAGRRRAAHISRRQLETPSSSRIGSRREEVFNMDLRSGHVFVEIRTLRLFQIGPEGVAVGWGKVFGVSPTSLFALDAATGRELWSTKLTVSATEGVDVEPQVVGHMVMAWNSSVVASIQGGIYEGGARGGYRRRQRSHRGRCSGVSTRWPRRTSGEIPP